MRILSNADLLSISGGVENVEFDRGSAAYTSIKCGLAAGAFGAFLGFRANASATLGQSLVRAATAGLALGALVAAEAYLYLYGAHSLSPDDMGIYRSPYNFQDFY